MAHTKEEIIKMINLDEPDYSAIANEFSEADTIIINDLTSDPDISISSKAVSTLGWIDNDKSIIGIENGAKSDNPILRIAAAQSLKLKSEKAFLTDADSPASNKITSLLNDLLSDNDIGVKKFALKSIDSNYLDKFEENVKTINNNEKNIPLKKMSGEILKKAEE